MNSKELRTGNIVYANNVNLGCLVEHNIESGADIDNAKWYWEIPLTEKWLKRLGFVEHKSISETQRSYTSSLIGAPSLEFVVLEDCSLHITLFSTTSTSAETPDIKYVHQLQNAVYEATREELVIKKGEALKAYLVTYSIPGSMTTFPTTTTTQANNEEEAVIKFKEEYESAIIETITECVICPKCKSTEPIEDKKAQCPICGTHY